MYDNHVTLNLTLNRAQPKGKLIKTNLRKDSQQNSSEELSNFNF